MWPVSAREKLNFKKANDTVPIRREPLRSSRSFIINQRAGKGEVDLASDSFNERNEEKRRSQPASGINGRKFFFTRQTRSQASCLFWNKRIRSRPSTFALKTWGAGEAAVAAAASIQILRRI